jgi:co-chaperonin GroES (HSP10)
MKKSSIVLLNPLPEEPEEEMDQEAMEETAKKLPIPVGYKMLIAFPKIEDKYDSGILKASTVVQQDQVAAVVGFVIAQGSECYLDKAKFPNGPWCKEGDFVLIRAYSGSRFMVYGEEFRLINDDAIDGVVLDPRGYSRVM